MEEEDRRPGNKGSNRRILGGVLETDTFTCSWMDLLIGSIDYVCISYFLVQVVRGPTMRVLHGK
jgi:hypothetical protein